MVLFLVVFVVSCFGNSCDFVAVLCFSFAVDICIVYLFVCLLLCLAVVKFVRCSFIDVSRTPIGVSEMSKGEHSAIKTLPPRWPLPLLAR